MSAVFAIFPFPVLTPLSLLFSYNMCLESEYPVCTTTTIHRVNHDNEGGRYGRQILTTLKFFYFRFSITFCDDYATFTIKKTIIYRLSMPKNILKSAVPGISFLFGWNFNVSNLHEELCL